ncbi:uncharacterized protein LACBIDRAFT_247942 [Laccaria bicolor S238N-H82]|uniref:Signal peptidase complex catalytic subunit SEC11 n=1 Tax=Laccaria bicolor (strain S238N-H82 / ATCC MYA-4686) TaxID=486041 RepID=B0D4L5_LACBS|nr:uncharacterized protein LACBIDRAFT_247942 [Laccaria bicolor S238N-H82]EDR10366.1 predicted protein [Laccaria bicolor S238N-H82]|eukprot:XP_001878816.1 predicted protein [Laccaria bicolor S238N-H82]
MRRLGFRHVRSLLFPKQRLTNSGLGTTPSLNFATVIASGLMIWKGLCITNFKSPIVVLSGSMEPALYCGDLLFLTNSVSEQYKRGDLTVYKIPGADIPIVHRVLETHDRRRLGSHLVSTKGDNNYVDDLELYQGLEWLERKHTAGQTKLLRRSRFLPYMGYVYCDGNDFPQLKYALLGVLGLLALLQRER